MAIYDVDGNIVNDTAEGYQGISNALAIKKNFAGLASPQSNLSALPAIAHLSDIHGDSKRFARAYDAAKRIGVDAFACTGDIVYYYSSDDYSYVVDAVGDNETPYLQCLGNHDTFQYATEQEVYTKFIAPWADSVTLPSGVTYPTYYHKDIAAKKLRIISVNQFQSVASNNTNHNTMHFHQEQITWFVSTLLSTPQDYGVIVLIHSPEQKPVKDATYTKFFQKCPLWWEDARYKPITEIVDAFISGTTLSKTYNNGSGYTPASVTVDADFSGKNSGVEFIAYLCGHLHGDAVSYVPNTTNTQLLLNVTCGCVWLNKNTDGSTGTSYPYYNEDSDLGKTNGEPCQDSFNIYVIDRTEQTVRIARIGASLPFTCEEPRDYMIIPYA